MISAIVGASERVLCHMVLASGTLQWRWEGEINERMGLFTVGLCGTACEYES